MNISPVWETFLNEAVHEALHWSNIGDINAADVKIMEWAKHNQFIVFTHDPKYRTKKFTRKNSRLNCHSEERSDEESH